MLFPFLLQFCSKVYKKQIVHSLNIISGCQPRPKYIQKKNIKNVQQQFQARFGVQPFAGRHTIGGQPAFNGLYGYGMGMGMGIFFDYCHKMSWSFWSWPTVSGAQYLGLVDLADNILSLKSMYRYHRLLPLLLVHLYIYILVRQLI